MYVPSLCTNQLNIIYILCLASYVAIIYHAMLKVALIKFCVTGYESAFASHNVAITT